MSNRDQDFEESGFLSAAGNAASSEKDSSPPCSRSLDRRAAFRRVFPVRQSGAFKHWRTFLEGLARSFSEAWRWTVVATLGLAAVGFVCGYLCHDYLVSVRLMVSDPATAEASPVDHTALRNAGYFFERLASELRSDDLLKRVAASSVVRIEPEFLRSAWAIRLDREAGLVRLQVQHPSPEQAVLLANSFASEALRQTRELWESVVREQRSEMDSQLARLDLEISSASWTRRSRRCGRKSPPTRREAKCWRWKCSGSGRCWWKRERR